MMIQDRDTLNQIYNLRNSWNREYSANLQDASDEIKDFIKSNEKLTPRHCTPELIESLYIDRLRAREPKFTLDDNCTPVVKLIAKRIARSGDFEGQSPHYGLDKGIMLLGGIGVGKTLLMRSMADVLWMFEIRIHIVPTYELTEDYSRIGVDAYYKVYYNSTDIRVTTDLIIFDDFGAEATQSHYGQITNVMAEVMLRRYDNNVLTFGTSNLDQKSLRKFYGERVWSRMKSMFNFIELKGEDRRR